MPIKKLDSVSSMRPAGAPRLRWIAGNPGRYISTAKGAIAVNAPSNTSQPGMNLEDSAEVPGCMNYLENEQRITESWNYKRSGKPRPILVIPFLEPIQN